MNPAQACAPACAPHPSCISSANRRHGSGGYVCDSFVLNTHLPSVQTWPRNLISGLRQGTVLRPAQCQVGTLCKNKVGLKNGTLKSQNLIRTNCTPAKARSWSNLGSSHSHDSSGFSTENVAPTLHSSKHSLTVKATKAFPLRTKRLCLLDKPCLPRGHSSERSCGFLAHVMD